MLKKKFVCAMISAAMLFAAVSGLTAFANPLVLDTADATGISYTDAPADETYANNTSVAKSSGTWVLSNGTASNKKVGTIRTSDDGSGLTFEKGAQSIERELSAKYNTNSTDIDATVKLAYETSNADMSQIIQVSSGTVLSTQPVYDSSVLADAGLANRTKYNSDGAVVKVSGGNIYYLNPTSGLLVSVQGIDVAANTKYYFAFVRGSGTYDLYVDTEEIDSNSTPVASNIPLISPTGAAFSQAAMWVGYVFDSNTSNNRAIMYSTYFGDIEFTKEISAGDSVSNSIYREDFSSAALDSSWWYRNIGVVGIENSMLKVNYNAASSKNTLGIRQIDNMDSYDNITVSLDFKLENSSASNEKSIIITSDTTNTGTEIPIEGQSAKISACSNSVHISAYNGKLYYPDVNSSNFEYLMDISDDTTYYLRADIDNCNHTYDLYISSTAINEQTTPVLQDETLFYNNGTAPKAIFARVKSYQAVAENKVLYIDNIDVSTTYPASAFPSVGTVTYSAGGVAQADSSAVSVNTDTITIPFGTDMDKVSAYITDPNGNNIAATGALSGSTYTLTITDALDYSKTYTVRVSAASTSTAGVQLGTNYETTFTTEEEPVSNSEWITEAEGVVTDNGDGTYSKAFDIAAGAADGYNSIIIEKADHSLLGASFNFLSIRDQLESIGNSPFGLIIDNLPDTNAVKIRFTSVDLGD